MAGWIRKVYVNTHTNMGLPLEKIHMETFAFHELKKSTAIQAVQYKLPVV